MIKSFKHFIHVFRQQKTHSGLLDKHNCTRVLPENKDGAHIKARVPDSWLGELVE